MKIKKFNENKLNISSEDLILNYQRLNKLIEFDRTCREVMLEYLILNPNLQEDPEIELDNDGIVHKINIVDFNNAYYGGMKKNMSSGKIIEVTYWVDPSRDEDDLVSAWLSENDVNDFIEFVKNPETYKKMKEYNL